MSDNSSKEEARPAEPKARVRPPRRLSIIWLIPLVTLGIAGWVAYKTISEQGPKIQITFETAKGLEVGKTKILYKGVQAGTVTKIGISEDLSHAIVEAEMAKQAKKHLTSGTEFWVVRPEVSLNRVSGLGTLVSGAYIAVRPGTGPPTLKFKGLDEPPITVGDGRIFILHAPQLGSIHASAPVYYRDISVGEVIKFELDKDNEDVAIHILIDKPYVDLVRKNSQFWNASGIDLSLGNIFNASMRVGSLESLVAGGIAFANPPGQSEPAPAEADFKLHDNRPTLLESQTVEEGLKLVLTADQLNGVRVGDAITYRQIEVGEVVATRLAKDAASVELEISIAPAHAALVRENTRFWNASGVKLDFGNLLDPSVQVGSLESLVAGGIAFATPSDRGPPAKAGHRFALLSEEPKDLDARAADVAKDFRVVLTADGLAGVGVGDPVLFREVQIGKVLETRLNTAASGVEIELGIDPSRASLVHTNSVFWNASGLKLNLGDLADASIEIESLKTLLAGGIALANPPDAGTPAATGARYPLHAKRPDALFRTESEAKGLRVVLKSEVQGSVKVDDPILYREVQVGTVSEVDLSEDADYVALQVDIEPRFASLVRSKSVFWNASGIHADFGLFSGAQIDVESLSALLRGGIAFATPKDGGAPAAQGASYPLHREAKKEWQAWAPHIRLPPEAPPQPSEAAAGAKTSGPAAGESTPAAKGADVPAEKAPAGDGAAEEPAAAAEQTAETPPDETAALPTAVSLPGGRISSSTVSEALAKLGFTNIGEIHVSGEIVHAEADWEGETVKLHIDGRTGRIERTD